jgi:ribosome recycling factor
MAEEDLNELFKSLEEEFQKTIDWFKKEVSGLRGSRLSIELFDNIKVNCYESSMSLKEVATLSLVDPRTVSIEPWDKSLIPNIEKCLTNAGLEGNIKNDGKRVLFGIPVISQEDKEKIVKLLKQKLEQAKESLRHARDEYWSMIQEMERKGEIPEDEKFKGKDRLQESINNSEKELEDLEKKKEKEIMR